MSQRRGRSQHLLPAAVAQGTLGFPGQTIWPLWQPRSRSPGRPFPLGTGAPYGFSGQTGAGEKLLHLWLSWVLPWEVKWHCFIESSGTGCGKRSGKGKQYAMGDHFSFAKERPALANPS